MADRCYRDTHESDRARWIAADVPFCSPICSFSWSTRRLLRKARFKNLDPRICLDNKKTCLDNKIRRNLTRLINRVSFSRLSRCESFARTFSRFLSFSLVPFYFLPFRDFKSFTFTRIGKRWRVVYEIPIEKDIATRNDGHRLSPPALSPPLIASGLPSSLLPRFSLSLSLAVLFSIVIFLFTQVSL